MLSGHAATLEGVRQLAILPHGDVPQGLSFRDGVMNDQENRKYFWLGNMVLAIALLMLLNLNSLWEQMGAAAMVLWAVVAVVGAYLLMKER